VSASDVDRPAGAIVGFRQELRESLLGAIRDAVESVAHELVRDEVVALVGEPWSRKGECTLRRNGSAPTTIFLDGERLGFERPRVRDVEGGREHVLKTVEALRSRDALDDDVKRRFARGISSRSYEGALTSLAEGLGLKKSAVSSAFQRAAQKDLDATNGRNLSEWSLAVVFIDGIEFAGTRCVVAMGVTTDGQKVILGSLEGATENGQLVSDLLASLNERGLRHEGRLLFVLDGSKALASAVRKTFGDAALIQRCTIHKLRNVLSYLPRGLQGEARRRMRAAWGMTRFEDALRELKAVVRWLATKSERAAASLEEGFEETLTIHALGVVGALRRTLMTTNPIESAFDGVRVFSRRVKRWRDGAMVMRWVGSGLVVAEKRFRRVKGHRDIPALVGALTSKHLTKRKKRA